jgi:hypothetical protein
MAVRGEETQQLEAADAAAVDAARKLGGAKSFQELPETGEQPDACVACTGIVPFSCMLCFMCCVQLLLTMNVSGQSCKGNLSTHGSITQRLSVDAERVSSCHCICLQACRSWQPPVAVQGWSNSSLRH